MVIQEEVDSSFQFVDAAVHPAPDLLLGEQREEALYLVQL
jgi:hypothetical protein